MATDGGFWDSWRSSPADHNTENVFLMLAEVAGIDQDW
jgi:hypothetical protein